MAKEARPPAHSSRVSGGSGPLRNGTAGGIAIRKIRSVPNVSLRFALGAYFMCSIRLATHCCFCSGAPLAAGLPSGAPPAGHSPALPPARSTHPIREQECVHV